MNFKIVDGKPYETKTFATDAGSTDIAVGDLVILGKTTAGYAEKAPATTVVTDNILGVAVSASDHTASVDGTVDVAFSYAGLLCEATATTPTNLTRAVVGTSVTLDVSGATQTIDENDTTNGFIYITENASGAFDTTDGKQLVIVQAGIR